MRELLREFIFDESGAWVLKISALTPHLEAVRFGQIRTLLTAHGLHFLICKMGIILLST